MESRKPRGVMIAVCILVLIQVYRISAYSFAQGALAGRVDPAWFFPAAADVFFGVTAPFIVFMLWRKAGLAVWVIGIAWLALSAFDVMDGLAATLTDGKPGDAKIPVRFSIVWLLCWILLDSIALSLLLSTSVWTPSPPRFLSTPG